MHKKLDNNSLITASIQRKDYFKPLESLGSDVKVDDQQVYIKPSILFTRLTAVAQHERDIESYIILEMSPHPPSLFKDSLVRKM